MTSMDLSMPVDMSRTGSAGGDDSDQSLEEGNQALTRYHQSARLEDGRWFGDSVSTSIAPIAVLEQVSSLPLVLFSSHPFVFSASERRAIWTTPSVHGRQPRAHPL
jgi:hypothetical protein